LVVRVTENHRPDVRQTRSKQEALKPSVFFDGTCGKSCDWIRWQWTWNDNWREQRQVRRHETVQNRRLEYRVKGSGVASRFSDRVTHVIANAAVNRPDVRTFRPVDQEAGEVVRRFRLTQRSPR
jgi:hypothetical protein